jgi:hypothetical protein
LVNLWTDEIARLKDLNLCIWSLSTSRIPPKRVAGVEPKTTTWALQRRSNVRAMFMVLFSTDTPTLLKIFYYGIYVLHQIAWHCPIEL